VQGGRSIVLDEWDGGKDGVSASAWPLGIGKVKRTEGRSISG